MFDDYDIKERKLYLKTEIMKGFYVSTTSRSRSELDKAVDDMAYDIKKAKEEIESLKLSIWKLENPPNFQFGDKVLFVPRRDNEYKTKTDILTIKGENHVERRWLMSALESESDFERFYFVEKGNSIITISEDDIVKFAD